MEATSRPSLRAVAWKPDPAAAGLGDQHALRLGRQVFQARAGTPAPRSASDDFYRYASAQLARGGLAGATPPQAVQLLIALDETLPFRTVQDVRQAECHLAFMHTACWALTASPSSRATRTALSLLHRDGVGRAAAIVGLAVQASLLARRQRLSRAGQRQLQDVIGDGALLAFPLLFEWLLHVYPGLCNEPFVLTCPEERAGSAVPVMLRGLETAIAASAVDLEATDTGQLWAGLWTANPYLPPRARTALDHLLRGLALAYPSPNLDRVAVMFGLAPHACTACTNLSADDVLALKGLLELVQGAPHPPPEAALIGLVSSMGSRCTGFA